MTAASPWQASRRRRVEAAVIPRLLAPAMKAMARSWRRTTEGLAQYDDCVARGAAPILACWHQVILPGTVFWRDRDIVILASRNFDGEWITQTLSRFGFDAVRGSSSRGGATALLALSRALRGNQAVAITVDGPRGPARVAQPGALWLARQTGHPILPFHVAATPAWHLASWDRGLVPRPRSRVAMVVGAPVLVGPDADAEALEARRLTLEAALADAEARAAHLIAT